MSKKSSKSHAFQFGLALFSVLGLSIGVILTTGNASLNLFSSAAPVGYSIDGQKCSGSGSTCDSNKVYKCKDGVWKNTDDCGNKGLNCEPANPAYPDASCQDTSRDTTLVCREDDNIWTCDRSERCKLKEQCKFGCVQGANPPKCKLTAKPPLPTPYIKCIPDGSACVNGKVCCGFCNSGKCTSLSPIKCIQDGGMCHIFGERCCPGRTCSGLVGVCKR